MVFFFFTPPQKNFFFHQKKLEINSWKFSIFLYISVNLTIIFSIFQEKISKFWISQKGGEKKKNLIILGWRIEINYVAGPIKEAHLITKRINK
jgi:hypothetical protein